MPVLKIVPAPPVRQCTPCTACCVHLPVPAGLLGPGAKPAGVPCAHLGAGGCRNHLSRPVICDRFRCAWLADATWPEAWRPDLSGLLALREWLGGRLPAALVYEIRPAALQRPTAAGILTALRDTTAAVVVVDCQRRSRRLLGAKRPSEWPIPERAAA